MASSVYRYSIPGFVVGSMLAVTAAHAQCSLSNLTACPSPPFNVVTPYQINGGILSSPTINTAIINNPVLNTPTLNGGFISGSYTLNFGIAGNTNVTLPTAGTLLTSGTLSAAMDAAFGSAQGDVLYRNATVWTALSPGTSGYFLETLGAGANPQWTPTTSASGGTVTSVSIVTANGFSGTVATPGSTPAITLATPVTGVLKGQSGALVEAVAGTDYLQPTSLVQAQYGGTGINNGTNTLTLGGVTAVSGAYTLQINTTAATNVTLPTNGLLLTSGTLSTAMDSAFGSGVGDVLYRGNSGWAALGSGTVGYVLTASGAAAPRWASGATNVTVTTANGFSGSVSAGAITLATPVTGVLKGNSGALTQAVANTDYLTPAAVFCQSILAYGGSNNGITDNTAAANAMISSGVACIAFPSGTYYFGSAITYTYPSSANYAVSLIGAGADVSVLKFNGSNGFTLSMNQSTQSAHVRNLTFATSQAGSYTALTLQNSVLLGNYGQSDVYNVTFRGSDGGAATNYWVNGIYVNGLSNINFEGDLFYGNAAGNGGVGVSLIGNASTSPNYGVVYNFSKCGFYNNGIGINWGTYIQGVTITQSNFVNGTTGVYIPSTTTGATELSVVDGNNFNESSNQIFIAAPLAALLVQGNLIYIPANGNGIAITSTGQQASITGNTFEGESSTGSQGILVNANFTYGVIVANAFYNLTTGVNLAGTSTWNVQANRYQSVAGPVENIGSNSVGVATQ